MKRWLWTGKEEMVAAGGLVVRRLWRIGWMWWERIDETEIPGCQGRYAAGTLGLDYGARTRAPW